MGWFTPVLLLSLCVTSTYGAITCAVRDVVAGQSTNLTCHFDEDVRESKKNIKVLRQPPDSDGFDPDKTVTVLECHWQTAEELQCNPADGYILHGKVSNTAVLGIQKASREQEGKYSCEAIPTEPSNIRSCMFMLKALPDETVAKMVETLRNNREKLEKLNEKIDQLSEKQSSPEPAAVAAAVIATLTLVGVVLLFGKECIHRCLGKYLPCIKTKEKKENIDVEDVTSETEPEKAGDDVKVGKGDATLTKPVAESKVETAEDKDKKRGSGTVPDKTSGHDGTSKSTTPSSQSTATTSAAAPADAKSSPQVSTSSSGPSTVKFRTGADGKADEIQQLLPVDSTKTASSDVPEEIGGAENPEQQKGSEGQKQNTKKKDCNIL